MSLSIKAVAGPIASIGRSSGLHILRKDWIEWSLQRLDKEGLNSSASELEDDDDGEGTKAERLKSVQKYLKTWLKVPEFSIDEDSDCAKLMRITPPSSLVHQAALRSAMEESKNRKPTSVNYSNIRPLSMTMIEFRLAGL